MIHYMTICLPILPGLLRDQLQTSFHTIQTGLLLNMREIDLLFLFLKRLLYFSNLSKVSTSQRCLPLGHCQRSEHVCLILVCCSLCETLSTGEGGSFIETGTGSSEGLYQAMGSYCGSVSLSTSPAWAQEYPREVVLIAQECRGR